MLNQDYVFQADELLADLQRRGLLSNESADRAKALHRSGNVPLLSALLRLNALSEQSLYSACAEHLQLPLLSLDHESVDSLAANAQRTNQALGIGAPWLALKGLMLAAHPDTLGMVRAAGQGASAEVKTALAYLETRLDRYFARNAAASR